MGSGLCPRHRDIEPVDQKLPFGRPVRLQCTASCKSRSWARFWSVTSRTSPTHLNDRGSEPAHLRLQARTNGNCCPPAASGNRRKCARHAARAPLTAQAGIVPVAGWRCFRNSSVLADNSPDGSPSHCSTTGLTLTSSRRAFHSHTADPDASTASDRDCTSMGAVPYAGSNVRNAYCVTEKPDEQ